MLKTWKLTWRKWEVKGNLCLSLWEVVAFTLSTMLSNQDFLIRNQDGMLYLSFGPCIISWKMCHPGAVIWLGTQNPLSCLWSLVPYVDLAMHLWPSGVRSSFQTWSFSGKVSEKIQTIEVSSSTTGAWLRMLWRTNWYLTDCLSSAS